MNFRARSHYEPHEWLPYDYNSVMHYRAIAFSKNRLSATIVPKDRKAFFAIGQRVRFSPMDLAKLNVLYNCGSNYYKGDDTIIASSPPKHEKYVASKEDLFSKPTIQKQTSPPTPEKDIFSEEKLFSNSGMKKETSAPKSQEDGSSEEKLFYNSGMDKETFTPKFQEDSSSEENLFSNSEIKKRIGRSKVSRRHLLWGKLIL